MPGVKAIRNSLLVVLSLLVLMNTQVYAELSPLLGDENFEDSLSYSAEWYRVTVPDASAVLSGNGITFTASGEPAGTVNVDAENQGFDNFWLTYSTFGFEVSDDPGVTTVVVDYGEAELPETLSTIYYEYQELDCSREPSRMELQGMTGTVK